ncbi:tRNA (cytosine(34)-C(5))-methyltransferase, mitochondrial [Lampris incognitus]|uniref:tRNA (cytosine(34)-C(5))-methyltransferase, mitochondrial n=1 Tax=Lampris incognitus TaxID=2546036 RepID=UPI0024B51B26|nr:tRNA (cytosine(34)-C(5))-methyltransferase, mitochondrial [Lampris incognitus]
MFRFGRSFPTRVVSSANETLRLKCPRLMCSGDPDPEQPVPDEQKVTKRRKRRAACRPVLDCFDQQYSHELGHLWTSARKVLLSPHSWQYGVMLNRFTILTDVKHILTSHGFTTFVPKTDASVLPCVTPTVTPTSQQPVDHESSLPPSSSVWPAKSDGPHLRPDPTSQFVCQDSQWEHLSPSCLPSSSLQCYIHPSAFWFPSQAHWPGHLKQYYLLNAASLLPVLALNVRDGEKVLDLCSAPGGKALAIMQTATPGLLCCNEPDPHRRDWLAKTLESFLPQPLNNRVIVSNQDGRSFGLNKTGEYDKVLVDAPCSNDRSWLYSANGQQGEERLKERVKLPGLQAQLLRSALRAVRPGGVVVYSTCTLSSSENQAVVEAVLNTCPEAEPEDLWEEFVVPFSNHFTFSPAHRDHGRQARGESCQFQSGAVPFYHHKHGILVVPQPGKTWGPMFLSRIRRTC